MFVYVLTGFYRGQHGCIGVYSVYMGPHDCIGYYRVV